MSTEESRLQSRHDAETMPAPPSAGSGVSPSGFATGKQHQHPERLAGYRIQQVLGQGGMGVVYLAKREDSTFAQRVALKVIKRGMDTEDIVRRFELERKVLSGLNHPNIARLIDGGTTEDGRPYFALEYVEGMPIDKYCDQQRLSTKQRIEIFRKVCSAVQYAHQNLIVHRDIKPGNVIVTTEGEPKLLDFGIAKLLNPSLFEVIEVTGPGMRLMTPEYASPEQVRGDPITTSSDVYSLGVMLYELLTGRRPYKFKTRLQHEIVRIVCEEEPEKPSTAISRTPPEPVGELAAPSEGVESRKQSIAAEGGVEKLRRRLQGDIDDIVLKALEKSTSRRYTTADQLAEDLKRHIEGMPVTARPPSVGYRVGKFVRRNRTMVTAAGAVVIALSLGVIGTSYQWSRAVAAQEVAEDRRAEAEQERQKAQAAAEEATRQKTLANQAWNDLWSLSTRFVDQFHESVVKLPGSIPARELLANTGKEYMEKLRQNAGDDLAKQVNIAAAFERLSELQAGLRSGNQGDVASALTNLRSALEIREKAQKAAPDDRRANLGLGNVLLRMGDLFNMSGEDAQARASYEQALPPLLKADDGTREGVPALMRIAAARSKLAELLVSEGKLDQAEALLRSADEARLKVVNLDPTPGARRNLSVGQIDFAQFLARGGRYDEALERMEAAVSTRRELLSAEPEQARTQRDLAVALMTQADVMLGARRAQDAVRTAGEARQILAALVEKELELAGGVMTKVDARNRFTLAGAWLSLGWAQLENDAKAALDSFRAAVDIGLALTSERQDASDYKSQLGEAHEGMARSLVKTGRASEALEEFERALASFEPTGNEAPRSVGIQRSLAQRLRYAADAAMVLAGEDFRPKAERAAAAGKAAEWAERGVAAADIVATSGEKPITPEAAPAELRTLMEQARGLRTSLNDPN